MKNKILDSSPCLHIAGKLRKAEQDDVNNSHYVINYLAPSTGKYLQIMKYKAAKVNSQDFKWLVIRCPFAQ